MKISKKLKIVIIFAIIGSASTGTGLAIYSVMNSEEIKITYYDVAGFMAGPAGNTRQILDSFRPQPGVAINCVQQRPGPLFICFSPMVKAVV